MKTPSFAKARGQVGAEPPEGLRREKPTAVTPAPEACAHTPAHTLARRALGRRARQPGSMVQSARPTPAVAPRLQATPPTLHPRKAIGQRGGAALRELAARAGDPPRSRSALQKPRQDWRDRGGWRCLARALPLAPGLRRRQQLRTCPLCVRCGQLEAAGRRVQAAGAQLLTGSAGGRAGVEAAAALGGVAAGDTLGCLEGAAGGGRRVGGGPAADLCFRGHLLSPLPPWAHPASFLTSFFTPVSSRARCSRLRPASPSPARSEEAGASHEPFVLGPFSISPALPPGEARSPGTAPFLLQLPAGGRGRWLEAGEEGGERRGGPRGKRSCQDLAAAPGSRGPRSQSQGPAGTGAQGSRHVQSPLPLSA